MIPEKIKFEILTPTRKLFSSEVTAVRVPGAGGYFGVYPGHTPFVATLQTGEVKVQIDDQYRYFATNGGFIEVLPDSVSIMADAAEAAESIDLKRAEEARARALKRIKEGRKAWDVPRAQAALARAMNRIQVAAKL